MAKTIKVTQIRSVIGRPEVQKRTIQALGLGKINKTVEKTLTPQIEGMINKVNHLVTVTEG
ncbi:50S ribosomal protein L30 [Marivirga atlantica]|jgi:large subunit ribosomal protein L30|uniref:Large ribosomal subunit protein uL30 n=1 Tax=Marivirga atlantica TaxID=1548457 RepID=A0A937DDV3_9BACT|nr:50S ribosomal protein L30 [Marivirga atlantica]MBL0764612.1 50S ribosomal protein L30 [Marivirga atlantica]